MTAPTSRPGANIRLRRLPRSNAPHPEESLAGYLLNLAYRLDLQPNQVIKRTGLKTGNRIVLLDLQYAIEVPPEAVTPFATATGLTHDEIAKLTVQRFTALAPPPTASISVARSNYGQRWINVARTRFCPACLTDDADPQSATWKVQWLTPWAIACPRHNVQLLDTCPSCGNATGSSGLRHRSAIPNPDAPSLHPASCRAALTTKADSLCGFRLDHAPTEAPPVDALVLQQRFDRILNNEETSGLTSLGRRVDGAQYLCDLRLLVILLQLSTAQHHINSSTPNIRKATQTFLQDQARIIQASERGNRTLTQPPDTIRPAIGLLLEADNLLADPANANLIGDLHKEATRQHPVAWQKTSRAVPPSERLFGVISDTKIGFADPRRLLPFTQREDRSLPAENVPAYLSKDIYQRFFSDVDPRHERSIRRSTTILLIRLLADFDTTTAGHYLGYNEAPTHAAVSRTFKVLNTVGPTEYRQRLAAILQEINTEPHINYAHRRAHFHDHWLIPDDLWITFEEAVRLNSRVRITTDFQARRLAYSAWVWATVTNGDYLAAPMINTVRDRKQHTDGRSKAVLTLQAQSHPQVHGIIRDLSDQLATRIDKDTCS